MSRNSSKNNILENIIAIMMIVLATTCSLVTIAAFMVSGCATTVASESFAKKPLTSKHLMYTVPDFSGDTNALVEDTNVCYTLEVVVSDENGKNQILKMISPHSTKQNK